MAKPVTAAGEPPSADGVITRLAVAKTRAAGIDPAPLLRQVGLDPAGGRRPEDPCRGSQPSGVPRRGGRPERSLAGFHLALDLEPRRIGLLYSPSVVATLAEALARAERYSTITNEGIVLRCDRRLDHAVRYTYVGCRGTWIVTKSSSGRRRSCTSRAN